MRILFKTVHYREVLCSVSIIPVMLNITYFCTLCYLVQPTVTEGNIFVISFYGTYVDVTQIHRLYIIACISVKSE